MNRIALIRPLLATLAMLITIVLASVPAQADEAEQVKQLAKDKIQAVIALLDDKSLEKQVRNDKIIETVNPLLDFELMAKLSLGKKHWTGMDASQQKRFLDNFVLRLQESYLEKLDLYTDEKVEVSDAEVVKSRIYVKSYLISKDDKMEMIYKFYKTKEGGWMVYDVEILGVSVVQTYRSQFAGMLKDGDYNAMLKRIETKGSLTIDTNKK